MTSLEESVAAAMETNVSLLPALPDLLTDLSELGTSAEQIVSVVRELDLQPGSRALDLGCGKGAVGVRLAEDLALDVDGVDGFPPFLEAARILADERGVGGRCRFRQSDIRDILGKGGDYDIALLLSLGPVSGDHEKTVRDLRGLVRRGGHMIIEDGFLADGVSGIEGYEGYADHRVTRRRLTAFGDVIVRESSHPAEETRRINERNTLLIRRRASSAKARFPALADEIDEYVARQQRETELLGTELVCALWALRRA